MSADAHKTPENLDEWIDRIDVIYGLLEDMLAEDIDLDYSAESLEAFEYAIWASGLDEIEYFYDAAAAYVGHCLLLAAGGRWVWDSLLGRPEVWADSVLGLPPISPLDLVEAADGSCYETYLVWVAAVRNYKVMHPDWEPIRQRDPLMSTLDRFRPIADRPLPEDDSPWSGPVMRMGDDPVSGDSIILKPGRYGPYVTDGTTSAALRQHDDPWTLTSERAAQLLADRRASQSAPRPDDSD